MRYERRSSRLQDPFTEAIRGGGLSKSASETSDAGGWGFYKDCEGTPGDSAYRLDAAALESGKRRTTS